MLRKGSRLQMRGEQLNAYQYARVAPEPQGDGRTRRFEYKTWVQAKINGTNDVPHLTLNQPSLDVTEDNALTASGTVSVTDPDAGGAKGESFTFGMTERSVTSQGKTPAMSSSMEGTYGTLSIDPATGKYIFTLNNDSQAVQELHSGGTRTETFHVVVKDSQGAFDIRDVSVTIHGKDDAMQGRFT